MRPLLLGVVVVGFGVGVGVGVGFGVVVVVVVVVAAAAAATTTTTAPVVVIAFVIGAAFVVIIIIIIIFHDTPLIIRIMDFNTWNPFYFFTIIKLKSITIKNTKVIFDVFVFFEVRDRSKEGDGGLSST